MSERPTLTDVLAAVFFLAGTDRFVAETPRLHAAFYAAAAYCPSCPHLEGLGFSHPPHPRSLLLDIALELLKTYGLLQNAPDGTLSVPASARRRIERDIIPKFPPDELDGLRRAGAILSASCGLAAASPSPKGRVN